MEKITKSSWGIKIIGVLFFSLVLSLAPIPGRRADAWMETFITNPMLGGMQEILKQLNIIMTGAAKQGAIKMITQNVYGAVSGGGGGGGPKFITNWSTALTTNPKQKAALYIEQLSKSSTQMKGSSFYKSAGSAIVGAQFEGVGAEGLAQYFQSPRFIDSANAQFGSGSSEDYTASLQDIGQAVADTATSENACSVTYEGNLTDKLNGSISNETFAKEVDTFLSGNNNKVSYEVCLKNAYEKKLGEEKTQAETEAIAYQGFEGTGQDGNISYPGSLVKEKVANVENMGNEVIANASGIPEVITSAVMKMAMDAMNNGIGNVQAQAQKSSANVSNKSAAQEQNQVNNYGPGSMYTGVGE